MKTPLRKENHFAKKKNEKKKKKKNLAKQENKTKQNHCKQKKKPCDKTQQDPLQKIILQKTETKLLVKKNRNHIQKKKN